MWGSWAKVFHPRACVFVRNVLRKCATCKNISENKQKIFWTTKNKRRIGEKADWKTGFRFLLVQILKNNLRIVGIPVSIFIDATVKRLSRTCIVQNLSVVFAQHRHTESCLFKCFQRFKRLHNFSKLKKFCCKNEKNKRKKS